MTSHRKMRTPARSHIHNTLSFLLKAGVILCLLAGTSGVSMVRSQGDGPILQAADRVSDSLAGFDLPTDQVILTYTAATTRDERFDPADTGLMGRLGQAAGVELTYLRPLSAEAHVLRLPERLPPAALQAVLDRLAQVVYPLKASEMGVPALRSALVMGVVNGDGSLSAISFLQAYPTQELEVNIPALMAVIEKASSVTELVRFFSESPLDGLRNNNNAPQQSSQAAP